jgi:hypothetical protein
MIFFQFESKLIYPVLSFFSSGSYSEFWNFDIPLKTQESKNFEISFENFQKMLDDIPNSKIKKIKKKSDALVGRV